MLARNLCLIAALCLVTACVPRMPKINMPEHYSFDQPMPSQAPMSYNDLLCCYECTA